VAEPRPAVQLLSRVFGDDQSGEYTPLQAYLADGGSIFPLVERGVQGLMKQYDLSSDDARRFLRQANSMAIYLRRQFIEQRLHGEEEEPKWPRSGLLSLVPGPSFEVLFTPRFSEACPPDALESLASPVAYLIELLRWARDRIEAQSESADKLPLHERRRDLKALRVDYNAVHQSVSAVDVILQVLENFIEEPAERDLDDAMIEARYPNGLPYFQHWTTLDEVARHDGFSVGSFVQAIDPAFPYFLQANGAKTFMSRSLTHASRLGAHQRELLTESPPEYEEAGDGKADELPHILFYDRNFGTTGLEWQNLNQVPFFGLHTKLDTPTLESLLSVRGFVPVRSANVKDPTTVPEVPESERSGSVYINAHNAPAISISDQSVARLHRLSENPGSAGGLDRYDRMNRKLRLDQWLDLPSEEVDALLVAAMKAEKRGTPVAIPWWITEKTVQALGLFQSLRERYGCTAHDFAVFIDEFSLYGRGETPSQFDQIFNGQGSYGEPLMLDEGPFLIVPAPGQSDLTVIHLCSALRIDLKTYQHLAVAVARAHGIGDGPLLRSAAILSSFYRMVRLPRLLGMTPVEGVLMLTLLGGEPWLNGLAGVPGMTSSPRPPSPANVLDLIHTMDTCVQWCADRNFSVLWMLQQIAPLQASAVAEAERQLFDNILNLLPGALFSHEGLLRAGVPAPTGGSWLELLTELVDPDGLVIAHAGTEADYLAIARQVLNQAVEDGLGAPYDPERPAIVENMLAVLLQARDAQASVVKEGLAVYLGGNAEQALNVLAWAGATVYQLLAWVLERARADLDGSSSGRDEEPGPLLTLLADVRRRGAVVATLELSVELLQDYLAYGYKAWLGEDDKHAFSLRTLYYLTTLTHAFELGEQPAGELLNYLREVNQLPDPLTGDALVLAQQAASIRLAAFFGWSAQEVRECANRIDPDLKMVRNLSQLDLLIRVRALALRTGMDALTIFLVGELPLSVTDTADKAKYKTAADLALLSLSETRSTQGVLAEDLKQLVTLSCVANKDEVVANKPNDSITFTVTLNSRDGSPLSGVRVRGRAVLGSIDGDYTNTAGVAVLVYTPGKVIGTETPLLWVDLLEPVLAPTVHVIADTKSLQFPSELRSPVPSGKVPLGQEVELYITVTDQYDNPIKNHPVLWTVDNPNRPDPLVFRPADPRTNQDGRTRVFVSSLAAGVFVIKVMVGSFGTLFEPIDFAGQE